MVCGADEGMWAALWSWVRPSSVLEKYYSENVVTLINRSKHVTECPSACGMASYDELLLVDNRWFAQFEVIDPGDPHVYR